MIYYFSATGNSLAMAKKIAEKTGDQILPVSRVKEKELTDQVIGIVFPVFYGDVPENVQDFIRSHHFPLRSYVYGVATCGTSWGRTFFALRKLLQEQGTDLNYSYVCPLIANSTICLRAHVPYKWDKLKKEEQYAAEIGDAVKKRQENHSLEQNPFMTRVMNGPLKTLFDRFFFALQIDPQRCKKCGECIRLCPVENIRMGEQSAVYGDHCIHCLACLHGCPYQAIKVRNRVVLKEDQYRHPGITVKELER